MTEETKATNQPAGAPQGAPAMGPDLTVSDLNALKTIIDVASSRGAFKAAEMAVVGNTYNRLTQFLDAVKPAEGEAPKQGQAPASADAEAPKAEDKTADDALAKAVTGV